MILLLGASGYIGQAFAGELLRRQWPFVPLSHKAVDYSRFDLLFDYVRKIGPTFLINAAGYTGNPDVDACELARAETLYANTILPQTIARVCLMTKTPWGHVSSGGIYNGAKVVENGQTRIEKDLGRPEVLRLFSVTPERFVGFTELDEPNFTFVYPPCNFYCGTKALAEEALREVGLCYIWRPKILFNELDNPRNFLSKIQRYSRVCNAVNSFSHLEDFVRSCLDLWELRAPFGIYNITNPGAVTTRQVVEAMQRILRPDRRFEFWKGDEEFVHFGAKAPRSNCILDVSKLLATGLRMRPVQEALEQSLRKWRTATPPSRLTQSA
jgi:dTDP-4-dehydrorhamnose reductase